MKAYLKKKFISYFWPNVDPRHIEYIDGLENIKTKPITYEDQKEYLETKPPADELDQILWKLKLRNSNWSRDAEKRRNHFFRLSKFEEFQKAREGKPVGWN